MKLLEHTDIFLSKTGELTLFSSTILLPKSPLDTLEGFTFELDLTEMLSDALIIKVLDNLSLGGVLLSKLTLLSMPNMLVVELFLKLCTPNRLWLSIASFSVRSTWLLVGLRVFMLLVLPLLYSKGLSCTLNCLKDRCLDSGLSTKKPLSYSSAGSRSES
jgi:hypothetical protein